MEITDAHEAGKGCKKRAQCFQVLVSSVRKVIKNGQLTGAVTNRSGRTLMWSLYHTGRPTVRIGSAIQAIVT